MNYLIIVAILLFLFAYMKLYLKPKPTMQFLQAKLCNFDSKLLVEKQPVLLFDKVVNPQEVIGVFFKYLHHLRNDSMTSANSIEKQNLSRFAIVYNDTDVMQEIYVKKYVTRVKSIDKNIFYSTVNDSGTEDFVEVKLPGKNMLVVPYLFSIRTETSMPVTYLSDFIHVIF